MAADIGQRWAPVLGRILLGLIFLVSGYGKITDWHGTEQFMAAKGFPIVDFFLLGAIVLEIGGSLLMMTGLCPKLGASILILFLIPTTFIFHNFWALEDAERQMQMGNFIKNFAVMGGCSWWPRWIGQSRGEGIRGSAIRSREHRRPWSRALVLWRIRTGYKHYVRTCVPSEMGVRRMIRTGYYALATVLVLMLAAVAASAQVSFSLGFGGRSGAGVITFGNPYPYYYPYGGYTYYPYSYYPYTYSVPYSYYPRYYRGYGDRYDRYYDRDRGRRDYYRYRR